MAAKIGTVTLPYGVQGENETTGEIIVINTIPMGTPVMQVLGRNMTQISIKTTVTGAIYDDLMEQQTGSPMVTFNTGGSGESDYGLVIENIAKTRVSKFEDCYVLDITAYKLDFDVSNLHYDLSNGTRSLAASSQFMTDDTDEVIDGYMTRLVVKSTRACNLYVQTSPTGTTWTSYPDDLGWSLNHEQRVIDLSNLTGYLRVVADNNGSVTTSLNIDVYMSKQE